ncbi:MAG: prepilin-type N-terminal cleavage/methylation domain-containing protein, partial [Synergistaceae bacterium]|nr:prepilin-type N-terminal cleavage/methylation domain-containing protein [Synergistaceae bacterium]
MFKEVSRMRKGFTLIEMLIVIVVIGILSSMMMLSST